ncbi:DUF3301 domain-containing protein [Marinomonas sp.]
MNLQLSDLFIVLCLACVVYFWWRNASIRERALQTAKQHCKNLNLQLLDGSVAGKQWRPTWQYGQPCIKRIYQFEFTSTGMARYSGTITYIGNYQTDIWVSPHHF